MTLVLRSVLFIIALPWTLTLGWGWPLLMMAIWAAHKPKFSGPVLEAQWRPWAAKVWRYSTTMGYGIVYQPDRRDVIRTRTHEHVHVRQHEDEMLRTFVIAAVVFGVTHNWILALCVWWAGVPLQLLNCIAAVLRRSRIYLDAEHERSAYAQAHDCRELDPRGPQQTWLEWWAAK